MKSLDPPEYLTFWVLFSQSSTNLYFSTTGAPVNPGTSGYGTGFYATRDEAEKARTFAILNDKTDTRFHIFELEFPNPAYKGG
jgi:hypothetical protein